MPAPPVKVVLDANVLYPFTLRDTLLRLAGEGFFQLYWSNDILTEMTGSLVSTGRMSDAQAARLRREMERAFPEAMVTGYGRLITQMKNEPKDRHVAAAAVKAGASIVVTDNLQDFKPLPRGFEAQSADAFLSAMFDLDGEAVVGVLREQAAALHRPPVSFEELLDAARREVPPLDVLADTIGHEPTLKLLPAIKKGGRLATVVGAPTEAGALNVRVEAIRTAPDARRMQQLAEDVAAKRLILPVGRVMRFEEIQEAHRLAEQGGAGKIVLTRWAP